MKMTVDLFRPVDNLFSLVCITLSGFFLVYCTYQYCQNEDSSVVNFSRYNDGMDNIYPGITFCFHDYFVEGTFSDKFEKKIYQQFLQGDGIFKDKMQAFAYIKLLERQKQKNGNPSPNSVDKTNTNKSPSNEQSGPSKLVPKNGGNIEREKRSAPVKLSHDLTEEQKEIIQNFTENVENLYHNNTMINLEDYLVFATMKTDKPGIRVYEFKKERSIGNETWEPTFFPSLSEPQKRCWTFEIPYNPRQKATEYGVMLNRSIFEKNPMDLHKRPAFHKFEIRLSYPGQQLTSPATKSNWGIETGKSYTMKFEIQNMVVMKRRNKLNDECQKNWTNNDHWLINDMASKLGCVLPHWKINTTYPNCVGEKLKGMNNLLKNLQDYPYPCQTIEKVLYLYQETAGLDNKDETIVASKEKDEPTYDLQEIIQVMLNFQGPTYMEITQIRAYDGQSLIGNAGGYVGLFLGVALIQLPSAILCVVQCIRKNRKKYQIKM